MTLFEIGPDKSGDLRTARSYFLIPVLETTQADGATPMLNTARDRLIAYLQSPPLAQNPVTDVYLISHGWHRNFFSAVAAYDRLISRFAVLYQRGRLTPKTQPYRPLFLAMHWNSDPEEDGWVDGAGRRDKMDFLQKSGTLFEPEAGTSEGDLLNTLEDAYELMTFISAPDVPALQQNVDAKAQNIYARVAATCAVRGCLGIGKSPTTEDKIGLLWRSYDEATPQRVLMDQPEGPHRFSNPLSAITNLLKFLVAAFGLVTVLGVIPRIVAWTGLKKPLASLSHNLSTALWKWPLTLGIILPSPVWKELWLVALLAVIALLILGGTIIWQQRFRAGKGARGLPVLAVGSWLPLQAIFLLPLLLYLFATFLFRTGVALLAPVVYLAGIYLGAGKFWPVCLFLLGCAAFSFLAGRANPSRWSLSRERLPDGQETSPPGLRDALALFAYFPLGWLYKAVASDSQVLTTISTLDKQLAFWKMQRKAVQAGEATGKFVQSMYQELHEKQSPALASARLHLIGHSFGGLVMVNAARFLAKADLPIHSLVLLQAALASAWFETEAWCRNIKSIGGALACIYSAYDMANGFYYPASNDSREAAGYVGLCAVGTRAGEAQPLGKDGLFASLVQPPNIASCLHGDAPYALNLDASRLIFEGVPAAGGGHDDVYKDDVIHMLWAVTQL